MNLFQRAKAKIANAGKRALNYFAAHADPIRTVAGKAMVEPEARKLTPKEWLWRHMVDMTGGAKSPFIDGFAKPEPRNPGAGYARRSGEPTFRKVNYRKQNGRVARALRKFNGEPATPFAPRVAVIDTRGKRDSISGVVS